MRDAIEQMEHEVMNDRRQRFGRVKVEEQTFEWSGNRLLWIFEQEGNVVRIFGYNDPSYHNKMRLGKVWGNMLPTILLREQTHTSMGRVQELVMGGFEPSFLGIEKVKAVLV